MSKDLIGFELRLDQLLEQTRPKARKSPTIDELAREVATQAANARGAAYEPGKRSFGRNAARRAAKLVDKLQRHAERAGTPAARDTAERARIEAREAWERVVGTLPPAHLRLWYPAIRGGKARGVRHVYPRHPQAVKLCGGKARALAPGERGPRGGRTEVQALLFPRAAGWTPAKAKAWAKRHGKLYGKVHVTADHVRLRQADPGKYRRMRTICLDEACSVKAVIGVR